MTITLEQALEVSRIAESALAPLGYHVGLTGGCLFRGGSEKDIDLIVYPHDPQLVRPDGWEEIVEKALESVGLIDRFTTDINYVNRVVWIMGWKGIRVDLFMS
jgi:hypothetical protein